VASQEIEEILKEQSTCYPNPKQASKNHRHILLVQQAEYGSFYRKLVDPIQRA